MSIHLKKIEQSKRDHSGYGAGSGYVINEKYECPCGEGVVIYEKDDIPGFRDKSIHCHCKECNNLYEFKKGVAIKNNKIR